jgi:hypothetical protein
VRIRFAPALLAPLLGIAIVAICGSRPRVKIVEVDSLIVGASVKLFSELAILEARDPSVVPRLLDRDPRRPSDTLQSLGINLDSYQQQLAEAAQVRPLLVFLPPGADPVAQARRHGLDATSWLPDAPPALLSGKAMDTLIVLQPLDGAQRSSPAPQTRIASAASLKSLFFVQGAPPNELDRRLYTVHPRDWTKGVTFEHTRCVYNKDAKEVVALLTYPGGFTDVEAFPLETVKWEPCEQVPDASAVKVRQRPGRKKPGRPIVIASTYVRSPGAPLLSACIDVK